MAEPIRIIETIHPLAGRPAHVFVFCLPERRRGRWSEVFEALGTDDTYGVHQYLGDPAGLMVYLRDGYGAAQMCQAVTALINRVLDLDLTVDVRSSFWFETDYGNWPGATTFEELKGRPQFVLPYLAA
jgi:hypothetical protein